MLGLGTSGPGPHFVVMEYLEHGDLTSFLASHLPEDTPFLLPATRTLSFPTLVYMAAQVVLKPTSFYSSLIIYPTGGLWDEIP